MSMELNHILKQFKEDLAREYGNRLHRLVCYGSQTRGEAHPDSDIDLTLVLEGEVRPSREIDRILDILADFNLRYGVLISVLPVDLDTWEKAEGPFWRNVRREEVEIWNKNLLSLAWHTV